MDKIEKLFRKISLEDRKRLETIMELLVNKQFAFLNITKIKGTKLCRARKGRYRLIFGFDESSEVEIYAVKIRNEKTYTSPHSSDTVLLI